MDDILSNILPIVFIIVGIALIVFIVVLIRTVLNVNKTVTDLKAQIEPTLDNVEKMTNDLKPAIERVDPLVERVTLTVDAANLELMRVDTILEDVGGIVGTAGDAVDAIDTVANVPTKLLGTITQKVREAMKPARASAESAALGAGKATAALGVSAKPTAEKPAEADVDAAAAAVEQEMADLAGIDADLVAQLKAMSPEELKDMNLTPEEIEVLDHAVNSVAKDKHSGYFTVGTASDAS